METNTEPQTRRYTAPELENMTTEDLEDLARQHGLNGDQPLRREDIIRRVLEAQGPEPRAESRPEPRARREVRTPERRTTRRDDRAGDRGDRPERPERPERAERAQAFIPETPVVDMPSAPAAPAPAYAGPQPARIEDRGGGVIMAQGVLEILPDGWGFLRRNNYSPSPEDIYV